MRASFGGFVLAAAAASAQAAQAASLLVPAYFYPGDHVSQWAALTDAASRAHITAIFNPNSGPGTAADPVYTSTLAAFRAAGGQAIAYVHTQNGDGTLRDINAVEQEIDSYRSFYTFDGIFVDEMTDDTSADHLSFYSALYSYIKSKDASYTVVGNPGTKVPVDYSTVADVLVTDEQTQAKFAKYKPNSWTQSVTTPAFADIVYQAPAGKLNATLQQAAAQNATYIYVTDDGADGNPYDSLPSYFAAEVSAVAVPEPAAMGLAAVAVVALRRRTKGKRGGT